MALARQIAAPAADQALLELRWTIGDYYRNPIMHGASPHELATVVDAYRANRPTLRRAVAANPGMFA
ncbi:hypothetical protein [Nocardia seriolae]|uniref:Luciferase n=1 Tax=Nocardia seriolae TaxID=37332 RepID=A0ABC9YZL7_9NOCA|nr:hypothetical protein [Nocardia seriolae]GEM26536.1 hypothetical protein NS2_47750 [Nocardia seriolae NBRC 15557]APA98692.1 hypothetical protein NS506_04644 [Nocardia seriolae]OJF80676.1 hypothetical protein NS14008_17480 [Nocardia seriolae]WKY55728.1 hypothetical protein Q5P07_17950 [Nocardia seriolae]WNJ62683.1 hypothetical protein RMO66_19465 [Nocardia seriolae]